MTDFWNAHTESGQQHVEQLKALWADGLSASAIARTLGAPSRNSVLSKVHRMGLSGRVIMSPPQRAAARRSPVARNVRLAHAAPSERKLPEPLLADDGTRFDLGHDRAGRMCVFIAGDPALDGGLICAHSRVPGSAYCLDHTLLCFSSQAADRILNRTAA